MVSSRALAFSITFRYNQTLAQFYPKFFDAKSLPIPRICSISEYKKYLSFFSLVFPTLLLSSRMRACGSHWRTSLNRAQKNLASTIYSAHSTVINPRTPQKMVLSSESLFDNKLIWDQYKFSTYFLRKSHISQQNIECCTAPQIINIDNLFVENIDVRVHGKLNSETENVIRSLLI